MECSLGKSECLFWFFFIPACVFFFLSIYFFFSLVQIKTMLPGEHQQVLSNLQSHFDEFLEDTEESEVFTLADCTQLERDVAACKEYYQELLRSAERGKDHVPFLWFSALSCRAVYWKLHLQGNTWILKPFRPQVSGWESYVFSHGLGRVSNMRITIIQL